jgi:phenylacetate-CoA ligase
VQSIEDLVALPITTKAGLRAAPREERMAGSPDGRGLVRHLTSGSTAEPSEVWRSAAEETLLGLFRLRAQRQIGVRARDRTVSLLEARMGEEQTLVGRLAGSAGLHRDETIDCRQPAERIAAQLEQVAPDVVRGYPSALAFVAPHLVRRGPTRAWPRLLIAGGETMGIATRRRIETGFDAPVFDIYGVTECNVVAWECPELGHLHVCDDNVALEVLRDGVPVSEGEQGDVVLTSLHSYTMPIIRRSLGDLAARGPDPCPCGQPFPTIGPVQGRVADYFHLPDGRSIHPFAITDPLLLEDWTWVGRHQMAQEDRDRVVLRISPLREPLPSELERIQRLGDETVGPKARFRIELVEDFPLGSGGKFQSYIPLGDQGRSGPTG